MIDLSRLGKYSLDPGCAEVGGTLSLILAHNSGSLGFKGAPSIAGNGQRLQGSPGHKHPVQLACADNDHPLNHKPQKRNALSLITDRIKIFIFFITLSIPSRKSHLLILNDLYFSNRLLKTDCKCSLITHKPHFPACFRLASRLTTKTFFNGLLDYRGSIINIRFITCSPIRKKYFDTFINKKFVQTLSNDKQKHRLFDRLLL